MSDADLHLLTGAYASGALTDDEHDTFVTHLSTCGNCRDEVAELVETATLLGIAAAEPPPPGFRERVMAQAAQTRQLPPVVTTLAEAMATRRVSRVRRWTMSVAASAVVLTAAVGAWALSNDENSDLQRIVDVQTAADAKTVSAERGDGAKGVVTVSYRQGDLVFMSHGLRDVGDGRTYQIWMLGPGSSVRSMGTFDSDGKSTAQFFRGFPSDATALAVTEEPAGGSSRPTTQPVLAMDLPRSA